uniref:BED-type domain-containing protein n=1 Tax=Plectus sambesii TaxID=2011161 RepID=A0A914VVQ0_9BILA
MSLSNDLNASLPSPTEATAEANGTQERRPRGPKRKWTGWSYFHYHKEKSISFCNKCNYSNRGRNTTTLQNHLRRSHEDEYANFATAVRQGREEEADGSEYTATRTLTAGLESKMDDLVARFFALPNISLNAVESAEFKRLMAAASPGYNVKSRQTVTNRIIQFATTAHRDLKARLQAAKSFSVGIDIWTAPGMSKSYLAMTAHFYDEQDEKLRHTLVDIWRQSLEEKRQGMP